MLWAQTCDCDWTHPWKLKLLRLPMKLVSSTETNQMGLASNRWGPSCLSKTLRIIIYTEHLLNFYALTCWHVFKTFLANESYQYLLSTISQFLSHVAFPIASARLRSKINLCLKTSKCTKHSFPLPPFNPKLSPPPNITQPLVNISETIWQRSLITLGNII